MYKKWMLYAAESVVVLILLSWVIALAIENERLRLAFGPYTVANAKNYRRMMLTRDMPMYNNIGEKYGVSAYTLAAIGIKENLNDLFSHGAKKMPISAIKDPQHTWQAQAAAKIVREELISFIYEDDARLKEFYVFLGKRYCNWDKNYGRDVFAIHKQIQEAEKHEASGQN